jgi:hypothetical protein
METLHVRTSLVMESKPDFDDSFMSQHYSHMPPCPPSTASSFSATSVQDPFTPTSGRSTPGRSVDLDSSIHMDVNMDMTPPPGSSYYPAVEYGQESPMRKHHHQQHHPMALGGAMGLDYHDNLMDMQSLQNYNATAPTQAFQLAAASGFVDQPMTVSMNDMCPMPSYHFDSPLSHKSSPASSSIAMAPESPEPHQGFLDAQDGHDAYRRHVLSTAPRERTAALEQATTGKEGRLRKYPNRSEAAVSMPIDQVTTVKSPKHQCSQPGCFKTYSRKEHLKRHEQS